MNDIWRIWGRPPDLDTHTHHTHSTLQHTLSHAYTMPHHTYTTPYTNIHHTHHIHTHTTHLARPPDTHTSHYTHTTHTCTTQHAYITWLNTFSSPSEGQCSCSVICLICSQNLLYFRYSRN